MSLVWLTVILVVAVLVGSESDGGPLLVVLPELSPFFMLALADFTVSMVHSRCKPRTVAVTSCRAAGKLLLSFMLFIVFCSPAWRMFASTGSSVIPQVVSERLDRMTSSSNL